MIFPTDPGLFMLLRCQPPESFFAISDQLYHEQRQWAERLQNNTAAMAQAQQMPPAQRAAFLVQAAGLDQFFQQRGMPAAQVGQCLANQAELQALTAITERANNEENVTGTPTFLINGELAQGVDTWAKLEPVLQAQLP